LDFRVEFSPRTAEPTSWPHVRQSDIDKHRRKKSHPRMKSAATFKKSPKRTERKTRPGRSTGRDHPSEADRKVWEAIDAYRYAAACHRAMDAALELAAKRGEQSVRREDLPEEFQDNFEPDTDFGVEHIGQL
jgi:hypothetical protein